MTKKFCQKALLGIIALSWLAMLSLTTVQAVDVEPQPRQRPQVKQPKGNDNQRPEPKQPRGNDLISTKVSIDPAIVVSPEAGEELKIKVAITGGKSVAGYQLSLAYDQSALEYVIIKNGGYLPPGAFTVPPIVSPDSVLFAATSLAGDAKSANGTLAIATFKVLANKDSTIKLANVMLSDAKANKLATLKQHGQVTGQAKPKKPVITQRADGGKSLNINTVISTDEGPVTALTTVYKDSAGMAAKAGTFIEYQVKFSHLSSLKVGGAYVHTADGTVLGPTGVVQGMRQQEAKSQWSHQRIALDPISGKKIVAITVGTKVDSAPKGLFSMLVDNIQLTDGDNIIKPIWLSADNTDKEVAGEPYGKLEGVESLNLKVGDDEVSVQSTNKMLTSWGKMKTLW
ncbi:MAG: cohesin domain-containing protein [Candidatus Poribacteria bacterium]|nr:cohesin domain-containing protein [Candidatus Poribacteria bacterium]